MSAPSNASETGVSPPVAGPSAVARQERLLHALNELWSLPPSPDRESQMDRLIVLIDQYESIAAVAAGRAATGGLP